MGRWVSLLLVVSIIAIGACIASLRESNAAFGRIETKLDQVLAAQDPKKHLTEEHGVFVMQQTYAHTIVAGTTKGDPPNIPVAIHVYTYFQDSGHEEETETEFASRHRAECVAMGATLDNVTYTQGS